MGDNEIKWSNPILNISEVKSIEIGKGITSCATQTPDGLEIELYIDEDALYERLKKRLRNDLSLNGQPVRVKFAADDTTESEGE